MCLGKVFWSNEHRKLGLSACDKEATELYQQEDISLYMPGKQDVVTVRDENGKRKEQNES